MQFRFGECGRESLQPTAERLERAVNRVPVIYQVGGVAPTLSAAGYDKLGTQEAMSGMYVVEIVSDM